MYFYTLNGKFYWGRSQTLATRRNFRDWIFRNKPAVAGRCYISGDWAFYFQGGRGYYVVHVSHRGGQYRTYDLISGSMYHIYEDGQIVICDRHIGGQDGARRAFTNRLREYRGKYFLPFSKHAECI